MQNFDTAMSVTVVRIAPDLYTNKEFVGRFISNITERTVIILENVELQSSKPQDVCSTLNSMITQFGLSSKEIDNEISSLRNAQNVDTSFNSHTQEIVSVFTDLIHNSHRSLKLSCNISNLVPFLLRMSHTS